MGRNKDRVAEMEARLSAATILCRSMGEMAGVPIVDEPSVDNIHTYLDRFASALGQKRRPGVRDALGGGQLHTFDDDVDAEIDRMEAATPGVTRRPDRAAGGRATGKSVALVHSTQVDNTLESEALSLIARELGINLSGMTLEDAFAAIHGELLSIKNPGEVGGGEDGPLSKGDTLAEQMDTYRSLSSTLHDRSAKAALILGRVAGALQVSQWDNDGTEIIEKAQRLDGMRHTIKRRIAEIERLPDEAVPKAFVIDELRFILASMMARSELARWLNNKPKAVATAEVVATVESPPSDTFRFTPSILGCVAVALTDESTTSTSIAAPALINAANIFNAVVDSSVACSEFINLMNLVIMPILARQRALKE